MKNNQTFGEKKFFRINYFTKKLFICSMMLFFACIHVKAGIPGNLTSQKGDFNIGLAAGIPGVKGYNAVMPAVSADVSWVLLSELINTKTFGKNGSVDLGGYYGMSTYKNAGNDTKMLQHSALLRTAFHFQFVDKLDTYAGIMSGANIRSHSGDFHQSSDVSFAYNLYAGARYYLTPKFAVKLELIEDFTPWLSVGVNFKF
jgi:hypothetical protein